MPTAAESPLRRRSLRVLRAVGIAALAVSGMTCVLAVTLTVRSFFRTDLLYTGWHHWPLGRPVEAAPSWQKQSVSASLTTGRGGSVLIVGWTRSGIVLFGNRPLLIHLTSPPALAGRSSTFRRRSARRSGRSVGASWLSVSVETYWDFDADDDTADQASMRPATRIASDYYLWLAVPLPLLAALAAVPPAWWFVRRRGRARGRGFPVELAASAAEPGA